MARTRQDVRDAAAAAVALWVTQAVALFVVLAMALPLAVAGNAHGAELLTVVQDARVLAAPGESLEQAAQRARDAARSGVLAKAAAIVAGQAQGRGATGAASGDVAETAQDMADIADILGRVFAVGIVEEGHFKTSTGQGAFAKAQMTVDRNVFATYFQAVRHNRSKDLPDPTPPQRQAEAMETLEAAFPGPEAGMAMPDMSGLCVSKGRLVDPWLGDHSSADATQTAMPVAANVPSSAAAQPKGRPATAASPNMGAGEALLAQGRALARQGQWQDAAQTYSRAVAAQPDSAAAYAARGYAYDVLGKAPRLCADFDRACGQGLCEPLREAQQLGLCAGQAATQTATGGMTQSPLPAAP